MLTERMCVLVEGRDLGVELNHQVWKNPFTLSTTHNNCPDISHRHSDVFIYKTLLSSKFVKVFSCEIDSIQYSRHILTASQSIQPKGCMVHMYK